MRPDGLPVRQEVHQQILFKFPDLDPFHTQLTQELRMSSEIVVTPGLTNVGAPPPCSPAGHEHDHEALLDGGPVVCSECRLCAADRKEDEPTRLARAIRKAMAGWGLSCAET